MPLEYSANGRIEKGQLFVSNRKLFDKCLSAWPDCPVTILIEKKHATRSLQANRYWWGVCVALVADHTGYTAEEVHQLAKQMFLPKPLAVMGRNGELLGEYVVGGTTTTLNNVEFGEFVAKFKAWALEKLDVLIPEADPDYAEKRDGRDHAA